MPARRLTNSPAATVFTPTIRLWRSKYAGMSASDLARLRQLEAENAQMQRTIAGQTVKIDAIEELMRKNSWSLPGEPKP